MDGQGVGGGNQPSQNWAYEASRLAARNAFAKQKRMSSHGVSKSKSKRRNKPFGQTMRPAIAVDTSYARHRGPAPRQVFPAAVGGLSSKFKWLGLGRSASTRKPVMVPFEPGPPPDPPVAQIGTPETPENTQPPRMSPLDVSPSDRPITIGLSVSPEQVSDHETPQSASPQGNLDMYPSNLHRANSGASGDTPTIIVTPAREKAGWLFPLDNRPRPASSVYSRATNAYTVYNASREHIPPVPAIPANFDTKYDRSPGGISTANGFVIAENPAEQDSAQPAVSSKAQEIANTKKPRVTSDATLFEEDQTPQSAKSLKGPTGLYIDTNIPPTPHRSRGWWNIITTPFEFTPSRFRFAPNTPSDKSTPVMPMLPSAASLFHPDSHTNPAPPSHTSNSNDVYHISNHYHYNGVPFHRDEDSVQRDTFRSTDTTPVVAVASLGTVLSARAVHEPQNPTSTPRSMNADAHSFNQRAPAEVPYFPPPPTQVHHHYQQNAYYSQAPPSYASPNGNSERGGTRRPFPASPRHAEKAQKTPKAPKAPKAPRRKGAGGYWHLFPKRNKEIQDPNDPTVKKKKKRRCCCWCCCIFFLILLIIMAALLGTLLPRRKSNDDGGSSSGGVSTSPDGSPSATNVPDTPSVWLNLTGFPPIPTGVATVAEPDNSYEESGCVSPETMWSCAVPKEQQQDLEPNEPNQPNFKFQIAFVNGTISNTTALQPTKTKRSIQERRWLNFLRTRDEPTPSPSPPSQEDQAFLGNTTDGNSRPFAGEDTPFFISFLNGEHVSSKRFVKRQDSTNGSIADIIPAPDVAADGTAAAANLLTFPANQQLKLYNRGAADEHYGFYTYYDRSIFLKNNIAVNSTDTGEVQADQNGGSTKDAAKVRCTWRQTRFLVQIWTNSEDSKALLPTSTSSGSASSTSSGASSTASSATNFNRPGSFPYPVTITLDRHGGNITEKMIYCYGMDDDGRIVDDSAKLQLENRDFGGTLVNPAQGPFGDVNVTLAEGGPGGIDGGTGGCGCKWRNWENA
ncbi:hypothetical protein B0J12DRAFT_568036 [Macrophomina phaseolina]|uniref:Glycoprotease family protein n=1 Tax=Macrophomina phaseolina TaxID=35725 RepID=A0ABQ8GJI5_9PEZI|nr:hypothetical protein B0J12DRAFT_568036 [Macrophomina phaseolina]